MNKILISFLLLSILIVPGCGKKDSNTEASKETDTQVQDTTSQNNQGQNNDNEITQETNDTVSEAEDAPLDPEFTDQKPPEPVSENTDSYGCLVDAGYTWCESKQACVKNWEANCSPGSKPPEPNYDMDRAIQIASDYFQNSEEYQGGNNLNILNVSQENCTGCWTIEFEYQKTIDNEEQLVSTELILKNWQVQN
ncbi:hypothetical protein C0580_02265 [Candidatus Parcubacteria bacterium]|nr:MAG: hypothetical protein C0580_02265 [Candidatus Parcubacteria bacterium]